MKDEKDENKTPQNFTTSSSENYYEPEEEYETTEVKNIKTTSKLICESGDFKNFAVLENINQNEDGICLIKPEIYYRFNENNQKEIFEFDKKNNKNNIEKNKQNLGCKRKKKTETKKEISNKYHRKYNKDNITCKIKRNLFALIITFLNLLIKCFLNSEDIKFKKIEKEIFYSNNEFNRELFEMKLIDLLRHNFKFRFKTKFENNNENALKKLEKIKNDENIEKYLNYTVIELYKIFYCEDYKSVIQKEFNYVRKINFKNIYQKIKEKADKDDKDDKDDYLKKVEKKMKDLLENYVEYFKSKNLFKNLFKIKKFK